MMGAFQENVLKGSFDWDSKCRPKNSANYGKRNKLFDHINAKKIGHKKTLELVL